MSWSTTRKYGYFFALVVAIIVLVGVPGFLLFYKAPTCFDGKQNGGERGVDCGGACVKLCLADFAAPRVLWTYSARVVPGIYNTLSYIQNPNQGVQAGPVSYVFKLYDADGILVASREGKAFIPAGQRFAVFESAIRTGQRIPTRTTFEFSSDPEWRVGKPFMSLRVLSIDIATSTAPGAGVRVENMFRDQGFSNVTAIIVLYDRDDNRISFSRTIIPKIGPGESLPIYFTWPEPFSSEVFRSELLFMAPDSI
jgi:hypothetical protein